jgi:hypothetical protein
MDSIEPFVKVQRYQLAICSQCQYAVLAKEILAHLRGRHQDITIERAAATASCRYCQVPRSDMRSR